MWQFTRAVKLYVLILLAAERLQLNMNNYFCVAWIFINHKSEGFLCIIFSEQEKGFVFLPQLLVGDSLSLKTSLEKQVMSLYILNSHSCTDWVRRHSLRYNKRKWWRFFNMEEYSGRFLRESIETSELSASFFLGIALKWMLVGGWMEKEKTDFPDCPKLIPSCSFQELAVIGSSSETIHLEFSY